MGFEEKEGNLTAENAEYADSISTNNEQRTPDYEMSTDFVDNQVRL